LNTLNCPLLATRDYLLITSGAVSFAACTTFVLSSLKADSAALREIEIVIILDIRVFAVNVFLKGFVCSLKY